MANGDATRAPIQVRNGGRRCPCSARQEWVQGLLLLRMGKTLASRDHIHLGTMPGSEDPVECRTSLWLSLATHRPIRSVSIPPSCDNETKCTRPPCVPPA